MNHLGKKRPKHEPSGKTYAHEAVWGNFLGAKGEEEELLRW
ncbi:hypothetical protein HMPREF9069_00790 [Atopobium sp. oral taxon 810 str. F0209]|nr:hypothetical protein HMPREF9069_00790 [Atopobium sp. oral taxon 810 str. F0209]